MHRGQRNEVLNSYAQKLVRIKARQICRKTGFNQSDEEDLKQEMFLHLLSQADRFNPSRASLNTFIDRVVGSCVAMILRDHRRLKRAGRAATLSLESTLFEVDGTSTPARQAIQPEDLHRRIGVNSDHVARRQEDIDAIAQVINGMPTELQDLCRRVTVGHFSSVANDLGASRRQVRNKILAIRCHFAQANFG